MSYGFIGKRVECYRKMQNSQSKSWRFWARLRILVAMFFDIFSNFLCNFLKISYICRIISLNKVCPNKRADIGGKAFYQTNE